MKRSGNKIVSKPNSIENLHQYPELIVTKNQWYREFILVPIPTAKKRWYLELIHH